ncbi:hypothetical protein [Xanthomonas campestris]|uniref:hypothetical protein n=1 Tax=Xanthomonas campestris TaxID=339 RepID=UPI0023EA0121|nr:hypothetical protein [Xanthomonas campestris]MCW1983277.1 hypothetical protein [Xanthomonas campestris]MCW2008632.1 hypothetical protein [Xanthomonas campestris]MEA9728068.1 hypothetical protein [Xanthomonas campestris pv. raphani]MEA9752173.1 hypothetical protein [Xanthomonas campestris pv. raphani]MEA9812511.1 hypothetical protein [Xanthomonas campestris pv. raphani]
MFHKLLLKSPSKTVKLDWLGAGAMHVLDHRTGVSVIAPSSIKTHMLEATRSLMDKGIHSKQNPVLFGLLFEQYGNFALAPNDLITRAALSQTPSELAAALLEESISGGIRGDK